MQPVSNSWISLDGYSKKYNISITTLKQQIKNHNIKYKLESGQYFIVDQGPIKAKVNKDFNASISLDNIESLVREIKSIYMNAIEDRDKIIHCLQKENTNLKSLVNILEES